MESVSISRRGFLRGRARPPRPALRPPWARAEADFLARCTRCEACIEACPTGALDEPGTLDATRCLSYWTQAPAPIPERFRAELGEMVYGCDICQEVCPWNRGVERRRSAERAPDAGATVRLVDWLTMDERELVAEFDRLYVPRNDGRWLRRNALVAAGNAGTGTLRPAVERLTESDDPIVADTARWAFDRMTARGV